MNFTQRKKKKKKTFETAEEKPNLARAISV